MALATLGCRKYEFGGGASLALVSKRFLLWSSIFPPAQDHRCEMGTGDSVPALFRVDGDE
jgi:hypothetical protein